MTKGAMSQVVSKGEGLRQIVVQFEGMADRTGNLGYLKGVGQPGAIDIPGRIDKYLRLVA